MTDGRKPDEQRYPQCPTCGYDLRGRPELFGDPRDWSPVRCPECGEAAEPAELRRQMRGGADWTLWRGLRWGSVSIIARALILGSFFACAVIGLERSMGDPSGMSRGLYVPVIVLGLGLGVGLIWRLSDRAGFESWLLAWMATAAAWPTVFAAVTVTEQFVTITITEPSAMIVLASMAAGFLIIVMTAIDS